MILNQRIAILSLLALEAVGASAGWLLLYLQDTDPLARTGLLIGLPFILALLAAAWRGWRWAGLVNLLMMTLLTSLLLINPSSDQQYVPIIFAPAAIAVVTANANWTLGAATLTQVLIVLRSGSESVYRRPDFILSYGFIALCLWIGRLILEQTQRGLNEALVAANTGQEQAQQAAAALEAQTVTLQEQAEQQHKLLATVSALETPVIEVAPQVLLAPIVGYVNEQRSERITTYILEAITAHRAQALILDITGITQFDGDLARRLLHLAGAVRLLGSQVILSGISPDIATTLVQQRIHLSVASAPTPFAALESLKSVSHAS